MLLSILDGFMKPSDTSSKPRDSRSVTRQLVWLFVMASVCSACGLGLPHLVTYQHGGDRVALQDPPSGYSRFQKYDHPTAIPSDVLLKLFGGLHYRQSGSLPLTWQAPRPVFTARQQALLATQLSTAFEQALSGEVIAFRVQGDKDPEQYTSGFCFVIGREFHLIIEHMKEYAYVGEPKPYQPETRWELLPEDRQRLYSHDASGKGGHPHWIVLPIEYP